MKMTREKRQKPSLMKMTKEMTEAVNSAVVQPSARRLLLFRVLQHSIAMAYH
jgi:hypothetical protein